MNMIAFVCKSGLRGYPPCPPPKKTEKNRLPRNVIVAIVCLTLATLAGCGSWHQEGGSKPLFTSPLDFYQGPLENLHAVREGSCPMHPSCSAYAREAFEKHGPVIGWVMTHDRVLRCGRNETAIARKINVNGSLLHYDPITNNDFWWYGNNNDGDSYND